MNNFIWRPEEHAWTRQSHVARFMTAHGLSSIAELRGESVRSVEWFWDAALRDMGIEWEQGYTKVCDRSAGLAWTRWFLGGRVNVTHNCIDRHVRDGHGNDIALFCASDSGSLDDVRRVTFAELAQQVNRCAAALCRRGVTPGDSVVLYAPMHAATVVVMFATMKIGARFVPIFCGYGTTALRERLASCRARILFANRQLSRRGKTTDTQAVVREAVAGVASIKDVVWIDTVEWEAFLQSDRSRSSFSLSFSRSDENEERLRDRERWHSQTRRCRTSPHEISGRGRDRLRPVRADDTEVVPPPLGATEPPLEISGPAAAAVSTAAEDPCLILYTSGTTGRPKGTVHTHAGCLAQMGKELRYAFDARPGDPFFWVTDIGWMMGPWELIGCLLYRTPVVLLDGVPNYPTGDRLWQLCERLGVVTLGVSPTVIRQLMRATDGRGPRAYDLSRLRLLGSTGEVWDETSYRWYFEHVGGGRCPVINMSGGTEIVGCHLSPTPLDALKPCSLGGPGLGMDVDVFTEAGQPAPRGVTGHLVCKQPAPSMTKGFLDDDTRYLETYFSRFPGVWYHGDWAMVDEDGQWFLFGRTDDTLKIAGRRVGPGEVESALTTHASVSEAAAIGVPDDVKGTALVCFVVLKIAETVPERELIDHVARRLGRPLAPQQVLVVGALPKTRSGKVVRGAIARAFLGQPPGDLDSVDNPGALQAIANLARPHGPEAATLSSRSMPDRRDEGVASPTNIRMRDRPDRDVGSHPEPDAGGARRHHRAGLGLAADGRASPGANVVAGVGDPGAGLSEPGYNQSRAV